MREILFRGKHIDSPVWVCGSYLFLQVPNYDWTGQPRGLAEDTHYIVDKGDINYAVLPKTVGQYTGLTDKNGVKIFEGDIVKAVLHGGNYDLFEFPLGTVVFEKSAFCLRDKKDSTPICSFAPAVTFEVIGNIYDNPELMEDKQC